MAEENFANATFEEKMKLLAHMSEADQARSAQNAMGFCEEYCGKCPTYEGTEETTLVFCTLGKSSIITNPKGCLCAECPIAKTMSLRWEHYCIKGKALELSEAERQ